MSDFDKNLNNEDFLKQLFDDLDKLDTAKTSGADVGGAAAGAGVGAAASFAALYGLGIPGLSAAGITSALAAAGALVGGGMVAGVGVLAAPIALLGVAGYAVMNNKKQARIKQLQRDVLTKAVQKQTDILERLQNKASMSADHAAELQQRVQLLTQVIGSLEKKLGLA